MLDIAHKRVFFLRHLLFYFSRVVACRKAILGRRWKVKLDHTEPGKYFYFLCISSVKRAKIQSDLYLSFLNGKILEICETTVPRVLSRTDCH